MTYGELYPGLKVWSMIGNAPEEFTILEVREQTPGALHDNFPRVHLLRSDGKTAHRRWPEQLAPSKEALCKMVFNLKSEY